MWPEGVSVPGECLAWRACGLWRQGVWLGGMCGPGEQVAEGAFGKGGGWM